MKNLVITPLEHMEWIKPGDDLTALLMQAVATNALTLEAGDVLVLAQKIVSKTENRYRDLKQVAPSTRAEKLARETGKDPRLVELVLAESLSILRAVPQVLIARHRSGCVMANAGIDASNLPDAGGDDRVLLLPEDADASAARLRAAIRDACGVDIAIVITDSFGRPWRQGVTNVAIGVAGLPALVDRRGEHDLAGRTLQVTQVAVGDLVASAAALVMGEGAEGIPAAHVRGLPARYRTMRPGTNGSASTARALVRPLEQDLFP